MANVPTPIEWIVYSQRPEDASTGRPTALERANIASTGNDAASTATQNQQRGTITTNALTVAAGATHTITLTNNTVIDNLSLCLTQLGNGTNTQGDADIVSVTTSLNTVVIVIRNRHASQALNGTLRIGYLIIP